LPATRRSIRVQLSSSRPASTGVVEIAMFPLFVPGSARGPEGPHGLGAR